VGKARLPGVTKSAFSLWKNATASTLVTSPISYCARYLGALETSSSSLLTLYVSDMEPHQLAVYVCDYDKKGREETIEIQDLQGHTLVSPCTVKDFQQGKWLRFKFSGSIKLLLANRNSGSTAVLSALMFDQAP